MVLLYKTETLWGRQCSEEEKTAIQNKIIELTADGVTDGVKTKFPEVLASSDEWPTMVRYWSTDEAANDWATFQNTFTPPPLEIAVKLK